MEQVTVVVWPSMGMDDPTSDMVSFTKFMASRFSWLQHPARVLGSLDSGADKDLLFTIDNRDVPRFAVPRLEYGMRWLSDVVASQPHAYNTNELMRLVPVSV